MDQPKPHGKGEAIFPLVIADLRAREQEGIKTYGESLRADNGRDALRDAYEEALDLALYLKQAMVEREQNARDDNYRSRKLIEEQLRREGVDVDHIMNNAEEELRKMRVQREEAEGKAGCISECIEPGKVLFVNPDFTTTIPAPITGEPITIRFTNLFYSPGKVELGKPIETILEEAQRLVHGDRGTAYGHPIFDFTRTADMVTSLLRDRLRPGARLEAEDIGQMMIMVKMSRHRNSAKRDNLTDTAGYAETLSMIKQWREENPGVDPRDRF